MMYTIIYWIGANSSRLNGGIYTSGGMLIDELEALLYYNTIIFTSLGHGNMHPEGFWMRTATSMQSFIGAFFIALFVVVLARKWMR